MMKVLQVVGYKNAGKTTLVCEIIRLLAAEGLRVGMLKRDAHDADPEPQGADTRLARKAGAQITGMTSRSRTMWVRKQPAQLDEMLNEMQHSGADFVLVEGFKQAPYPKVVLLRSEQDLDLLALPGIIAVGVREDSPGNDSAAANKAQAAGFPVFRTDRLSLEALLAHIQQWRKTNGNEINANQ